MPASAAMSASPEKIFERHIIGKGSREWLVAPGEVPALTARHVEWGGLSDLKAPYEIARPSPGFGHVLGCVEGEGEIWFEGEWRTARAGIVFVNPPGRAEALRAVPGREWRICWVHASPAFFGGETGSLSEPYFVERDARPLWHALEGLRLCVQAEPRDELADAWSELVAAHARRLMARGGGVRRLARVWEEVAKAPAAPWTIKRLGALAGMSREHLRREAIREAGRPPMEQVAHLRMRRAADLLRLTNETLESIAEAVGYGNAFVFSNAFTRVMGLRPGAYRAAARQSRS
jgi:AraC-like DNA-binding protein